MPIKIPDNLPASDILSKENIFVMHEKRALTQDIRSLKIVILNLMPTKIETETQILRLLGNSPLQVDIILLHPATHKPENTSQKHLSQFYHTFNNIKDKKFDGLIITGAPVENLAFNEVNYWEELKEIMDWSCHNIFSSLHICWGAQAALYHHYQVPKYPLSKKMFGIFNHTISKKNTQLLRGFDDQFYAPHSRYTEIKKKDIEKVKELEVLAESKKAGLYIIAKKDGRQIFVTGHGEYDPLTLKKEYLRDLKKGIKTAVPQNYFPQDNPQKEPIVQWRGHANLFFSNWLNYYVYQQTPYRLEEIK